MMLEAQNKLPQNGLDRILIRGTNWIGDAIMTLPAVASVREAYPEAHLAILAKPPVSEIYRLFSEADEILPYESRFDTPLGVFALARRLRALKFDAAILLQNAIEAAIIARVAGIPVRAGFNTDGRGLLLTHPVGRTEAILKVHQIDYYLEMVKALGCADVSRVLHLDTFLSRSAAQDARVRYVPEDLTALIGLAPGATYGPAKRWFPERFAEVGDRLCRSLSARALLFGSAADREVTDRVAARAKMPMINLAGQTGIEETVYLLSQCRVVISNDSGLMHVAAGLNVPTVAIFGSTNPQTTSPSGEKTVMVRKPVSCSPCLKKVCPTDFRCMDAISVDDVVGAANILLKG